MKKTLIALMIGGLAAFAAYGQDTAKEDLKKSGQDVKEAGKDTGHAAKSAAKGVKKGTKKAVHKTAKETKKGAEQGGGQNQGIVAAAGGRRALQLKLPAHAKGTSGHPGHNCRAEEARSCGSGC